MKLPALFLILVIVALLVSCTPAPTPTRTVTPTIAAMPTQTHTATLTLTLPATSTPAFSPTPTLVPSSTATPRPSATSTRATIVNGIIARQHLYALSETIGARVAGSPQEMQAAQYIQTTFEKLGYKTEVQALSITTRRTTIKSANVIATKPGASNSVLIVGAHYDSTGDGKGADDNASGVAVMLEVAEKVNDIATPYTIRFIAFGAEEIDLNGARFYVEQMSRADRQNTIGMINLDSLTAGDIAYIYGDAGSARSIRDWVLRTASAQFRLATRDAKDLDEPDGTPCDCADYGPFQAAGIPFAYFESTNWNLGKRDGYTQVDLQFGQRGEIWHTKFDTLAYIDATFPCRIDQHLQVFITLLYETLTQFK